MFKMVHLRLDQIKTQILINGYKLDNYAINKTIMIKMNNKMKIILKY
jgi:hypothetical protein